MKTALLKVKRAKSHLESLKVAIADYRNLNPNVLYPQHDIHADTTSWVVKISDDVKDEIALFLGDIIYNARSSFDILAYSLLLDSGLTPTRRTYYPFIGIDSDLQTKLTQTGLDVLPSHHLNFFGTHPPSKTSNLALYASHVLVIVDKHRTIAPVASYVEIEHLVVSSSSVPMGFGRIRTPLGHGRCFLGGISGQIQDSVFSCGSYPVFTISDDDLEFEWSHVFPDEKDCITKQATLLVEAANLVLSHFYPDCFVQPL
jgi:hypothetical protein